MGDISTAVAAAALTDGHSDVAHAAVRAAAAVASKAKSLMAKRKVSLRALVSAVTMVQHAVEALARV